MTSESVCIESSDVTISVDESASRSWRRPFLKWAGGKYSMLSARQADQRSGQLQQGAV